MVFVISFKKLGDAAHKNCAYALALALICMCPKLHLYSVGLYSRKNSKTLDGCFFVAVVDVVVAVAVVVDFMHKKFFAQFSLCLICAVSSRIATQSRSANRK